MAHNTRYSVRYRRKREGKTDYHKRLRLLKSRLPRLVVRKTVKHIVLQIIEYNPTGDKILVEAHSRELTKKGWPVCNANIPEAYLTGLLIAKKAGKMGEVISDTGRYPNAHGSKVYAAIKGAIDGGLQIPCSDDAFPSEDRISGKHIAEYAKKLDDKEQKVRFSRYIKAKVDPARLDELFENVKANIRG